jgi:hypothetical protein
MEFLAGSVNGHYAIYRNHCCGDELILYPGIRFPNCKRHNEIVTRWQMVGAISVGPLTEEQGTGGHSTGGQPAA